MISRKEAVSIAKRPQRRRREEGPSTLSNKRRPNSSSRMMKAITVNEIKLISLLAIRHLLVAV